MSGCHVPEDKGNTHHCIGCGVVVNDCKCIWNNYRSLYEMYRELHLTVENHWRLTYGAQDNLSKRINEVESKSVSVNLLHTHSQSIDTWKKGNESYLTMLSKRVQDIEYRLKHIVELPCELDIRLQEVERRIDNMGTNVGELRKICQESTSYIERIGHLGRALDCLSEENNRLRNEKTPHKCPLCEGKGFKDFATDPYTALNSPDRICKPCEGKGIVWG